MLEILKNLKIGDNSALVNNKYVVIRTGNNTYRIGEKCGDWLKTGTLEEIIARALK